MSIFIWVPNDFLWITKHDDCISDRTSRNWIWQCWMNKQRFISYTINASLVHADWSKTWRMRNYFQYFLYSRTISEPSKENFSSIRVNFWIKLTIIWTQKDSIFQIFPNGKSLICWVRSHGRPPSFKRNKNVIRFVDLSKHCFWLGAYWSFVVFV